MGSREARNETSTPIWDAHIASSNLTHSSIRPTPPSFFTAGNKVVVGTAGEDQEFSSLTSASAWPLPISAAQICPSVSPGQT